MTKPVDLYHYQELFNQFQYSKESALPPDSLRLALAETFSDQRRFQLGFMDDAAECFVSLQKKENFHGKKNFTNNLFE